MANDEKRTGYCRACGGNAGHGFLACKNIAGLREIIKGQDAELSGAMDQIAALKFEAAQNGKWRSHAVFMERTCTALLDLAEAYRKVGN